MVTGRSYLYVMQCLEFCKWLEGEPSVNIQKKWQQFQELCLVGSGGFSYTICVYNLFLKVLKVPFLHYQTIKVQTASIPAVAVGEVQEFSLSK